MRKLPAHLEKKRRECFNRHKGLNYALVCRSPIQRIVNLRLFTLWCWCTLLYLLTVYIWQLEHLYRTHQFLGCSDETGGTLILRNQLLGSFFRELSYLVRSCAQDGGYPGLLGGAGCNRGHQPHQSRGSLMRFAHPLTRVMRQFGFVNHLLDGFVNRCNGVVGFYLNVLYQLGDLTSRLS